MDKDNLLLSLRKRAEKAVQNGDLILNYLPHNDFLNDIEKVIEEFCIYRAELELQHEELIRSQSQTQQALSKYQLLFKLLPVTGVVLNSSGIILEANIQAVNLFGFSSERSLLNHSFYRLIEESDSARVHEVIRKNNQTGQNETTVLRDIKLSKAINDRCNALEGYFIRLSSDYHLDNHSLVLLVDRSAEQALTTAQQSHEDIVNLIPNTIVITDPQRRITFVNEYFEQETGYCLEEVLGKPVSILQGPDTDPRQIQSIRDSLNEQKRYCGEILNYKKDGTVFWNDLTITPIFNGKHQIISFIGIQRDITNQKLQQIALVDSEQRFRELSNIAPSLIWQADRHNKRVWFNKSWLEFTGRSLEDEQGDGWKQGIHPEDYADYIDRFGRCFDRHEIFNIEYRLRRADGEYRWIDGRAVPKFNENGDFDGYVGTCTDVSDIRNSKAATDFFNHANEVIYSTDLNGIILDCNQRFSDITGYTRQQVIGRHIRILKSGVHDKEFYADMWRQIRVNGHWRGEITNRHKEGHFITVMTSISTVYDADGKPKRYLAIATDMAIILHQRQELEQLAYFDNLTGLPNRSLLMDRLVRAMSRAKRRGGFVAVLFVDLDGFKTINDHYGHDVGDEFLVAISQKMKVSIRNTDTLARIGGDEFIIILDELNSGGDIKVIVPAISKACRAEFLVRGVKLSVSASIGVRLYPIDPLGYECNAETMINEADQAMYVAKRQGKNRYHLFNRTQDQVTVTRNNAIEAIKTGLNHDEFELYYQPKVNMRTGEVLGFEALIRWNKNKSELLEPSKFLPIVQNSPLGIELGDWIIKTAVSQLAYWQEHGLETSTSVNVDARQLLQSSFVEHLQAEINKQPQFKSGSLVLEILETTEIEDRVKVTEVIESCRALGVDFHLDDFGTGYSSITYVRELPFKTLKIDRSFIADITHSTQGLQLVANIIRLANDLGKKLIAEGVETIEQGQLLIKLGCEIAQGYAIAKPMPASEVLTWLSDWQPYLEWQSSRV